MTASLSRFKKSLAAALLACSFIACSPHQAMASSDDEVEHYDARVQGYEDPNVELKSSSTGSSWILLLFLGVACVAVLFKDAKRSHLD